MARKRYGEDDILRLIREVEVHCNSGMDVVSACRSAGVSDKTYYGWRRKYGGMNRARLSEMKTLEKENQRLKKIVADLELDKLIRHCQVVFAWPNAIWAAAIIRPSDWYSRSIG